MTFPGVAVDRPPGLPPPTAAPAAMLTSAADAKPALPGPPKAATWHALPPPAATAIEKLALTELGGPAIPDGEGSGDVWRLTLPPAVADRLRSLLDRQRAGKPLTAAERAEAHGLLDIAEYFVIQRLRRRLAA